MFNLRPIGCTFIIRTDPSKPQLVFAKADKLVVPEDPTFAPGTVVNKGVAHSPAMQVLMDSIPVGAKVFFNRTKSIAIPGTRDFFLVDLESIAGVLEPEQLVQ